MPYTRLTGPILKFWDANNAPAVGYKIWQVAAGTSDTTITTYGAPEPDGSLGTANANPIILPANGECDVITLVAVKLCYCLPTSTSPTDGVIETFDWLGQQQGIPPIPATVVGTTTHNNYVLTTSPIATSITDQQMITFIPDVSSLPTLVTPSGATSPTVFTGTGINDCFFSGPYVGTIPGSVFKVTVVAATVQPPGAPTLTAGAAGLVDNGDHYALVTFVTPEGETLAGTPSALITILANDKIEVSNIPVGAAGQNITDRNIYITLTGGDPITGPFYLVGPVGDDSTTTYEINVADATIGPAGTNVQPPSINTTGDGAGADLVHTQIDDGSTYDATVSITEAEQDMILGISFKFAVKAGHTVGDIWTVTVETPVKITYCTFLADKLAYKLIGGEVQALDLDLIAGYSSTLVWNEAQDAWILNNPSLPATIAEGGTTPKRVRKEIYADYTVQAGDASNEISCNADCTIIFPPLHNLPNDFFYIHPNIYNVTVATDPATPTDVIIPPFSNTGVTTYKLFIGGPGTVQMENNSSSLHILTQICPYTDTIKTTIFTIPSIPTVSLSSTAGIVTTGTHYLKVAFVMGNGYTIASAASLVVNVTGGKGIDVSDLPIGLVGTTARRIYMNKANAAPSATYYKTVDVPDNTATTFFVNVADASLTVAEPTTGLWTKTAGYNWADVEVVAPGGGGYLSTIGPGGGAGGRALKLQFDISAIASETVTLGTKGTIYADGGTSSFGSVCSATGGKKGDVVTGVQVPGAGGIGTGGNINIPGENGKCAWTDTGNNYGGDGGSGPYGAGGIYGADALGYGAGGGQNGDGTDGIVIVKEYR